MPSPLEVFDDPAAHWALVTSTDDADFETQFFDRKEATRAGASGGVNKSEFNRFVEEKIVPTASAFANGNAEGGLLALGIGKGGEVRGIAHLDDNQQQQAVSLNNYLRGLTFRVKSFECEDFQGNANQVLLIYIRHSDNCISETNDKSARFWVRRHNRNEEGDDRMRDQLRRDKRIIDFESTYCCPFYSEDLDKSIVYELARARGVLLGEAENEIIEFLSNIGALQRLDTRTWAFNNAGCLFFRANPQSNLAQASLRLMRFSSRMDEQDRRGVPTFHKLFTGPLTTQIRAARVFLQEAAFLRTLPRRNPDGGFSDELEVPFEALDEAIVNAIAHRDYAVGSSVDCEAYEDGVIVRNAGRVIQLGPNVPSHFSLDSVSLTSLTRNPKLLGWLRDMKDERGAQFVRAVAEGTKTMRRVMDAMGLPAPEYTTDIATEVRLRNNEGERKALLKFSAAPTSSEFSNLFPLEAWPSEIRDGQPLDDDVEPPQVKAIVEALGTNLTRNQFYIHSRGFSRLIASPRNKEMDIRVPAAVSNVARFFPAFALSVRRHWDRFYLCIDYAPKVRNVLRLDELMPLLSPSEIEGFTARAHLGRWRGCRILRAGEEWATVRFHDDEQEEKIPSTQVVPELSTRLLQKVLNDRGVPFDLVRAIKEHSLALRPGTARTRFDKIQAMAVALGDRVFPFVVGVENAVWNFELHDRPAFLKRQGENDDPFQVRTLREPKVKFQGEFESPDIREGITRYGSYDHPARCIELVPVVLSSHRDGMADLIARLQHGKFKYRGAEHTFGVRFTYGSLIASNSEGEILTTCQRLFDERPEWKGNANLDRIFLVHTPESHHALDDENTPYYAVKRMLLEKGVPCQMVDTPTLQNADYKDLNLALNLTAKCGITPWVLPEQIPDADFFIGLSYTQNGRRGQERLMGYANVFNEFGRWQFYSGNERTFPYEERARHLGELAEATLQRLDDEGRLPPTANISFHYSAKFSRFDRRAVIEAARRVRPQGTFSFVSINSHHDVRLFDSRPETDGSLPRGNYVVLSPSQFLLSTTGHNPYRKALGTPQMLEVKTWIDSAEGSPSQIPDLRVLALQILSLTKLNWASTDSLCGEPITTKYAGDIAYLTAAFLRQKPDFQLHKVLERTPWFI
jgi:predicted HTH transcriptional regulator